MSSINFNCLCLFCFFWHHWASLRYHGSVCCAVRRTHTSEGTSLRGR